MESSWLSNTLNRILFRLNSVFFKIMAAMIIVSIIAFMFVPLILEELREATTRSVIASLSEEQSYLFEEILENVKESVVISAQPFVLKHEIISTSEDIKAWEGLLLGLGNSLNRQYGLIRIMTFDLSGGMIHDYGIDSNMPQFDPQQLSIKTIIAQCLETESSSESVVSSSKNSPYWGLCFLSEDKDEEVSNVHLFILDYNKILKKIKKTTGIDMAIQIGDKITHDNLGKEFIDSIIKNEKTLLTTDSEGKEQHYITGTSAIINRHILTKNREPVRLIYFINSEKINASFQAITTKLKYMILLIAVFSSLLLLATIYYLLRPLKGVTKIAQAVSNGDYNVRLNHKSRDEIGTAMNTIDNMLDKIQLNYKIISREISERKHTEEKLELILDSCGEGIYGLDLNGNTTFINPAAAKMTGWNTEELIGMNQHDILHHTKPDGTTYPLEECPIHAVLKAGADNKINTEVFLRKDGSSFPVEYIRTPMWDTDDKIIGAVVTFMDITERNNAEQKLHYMAYYDQLTQLPNRISFISYLGRMLERTKCQSDYLFAVLFIDIDRFKVINDSLGHLIGDKLLIEVARRLEASTRPTDRISHVAGDVGVARFGGDEFAVFLNNIKDISSASQVADRIQMELQKPFKLDGHELYTSASIGIALSTTRYENAEDMLRDADSAMYRAKDTGRARAEIFDDDMHVSVLQILKLESDLRTAVEKEQFVLYYQPIVSATDGRITGAEALVRWNHPQQGIILPVDFIPIAEETGLISKIGEWVLRTACAQNKAWQDEGYQNILMKVNFSSRQFKDDNLTEVVTKVIRETNMPAQLLDVEITESIAMEKNSIHILNQLAAMGLQTSIDDFGTGYSSLGSLTLFPINSIKIDSAFVKDIGIDVNAEAIIKAIIAMTHSLNMEVVAEGVETEEQLAFLQTQKCDKIQGHLFSRPVPKEHFIKLLEKDNSGSSPINKHSASIV